MKKLNLIQRLVGNELIKDKIVSGTKASWHIYFNEPSFNWYRIRGVSLYDNSETADLAFQTDKYQDLEVVYVVPTGLGDREVTVSLVTLMIQNINSEKYNDWIETENSQLALKDEMTGVYCRGKAEVDGKIKITQDVYIFCKQKQKNDTLIQLSSIIPAEAPDELTEEVRKIFESIKIS